MKLATLHTKITASAALVATAIKTVKIGYLTETSGQEAYDMLIMVPPKIVGYDPRQQTRDWKITWYIVALDQTSDKTRQLTPAERVTKWDTLASANKALIAKICDDSSNYHLLGTMDIDYNSAGPGMLVNEAVVWIQCDFTLRTNDCID
jgi:hypothetical protein